MPIGPISAANFAFSGERAANSSARHRLLLRVLTMPGELS
jgi:hypothetical protein